MELEKAKAPMENHGMQTKGLAVVADVTGSAIPQRGETGSIPLPQAREKSYLTVKRCFDFLLSLVASVLMSVPLLLLMALIVIKDPGNPLYFQKRVGKGGHPIFVAKLRTMKKKSDHLEEMLTPEQLEEYKREYKLKDDPRLIGWKKPGDGHRCFGAMLRRLSLDELPQIFYNICLKGDMSVVGPRPILQEELEKNYSPEEQRELLSMKPGLTGYWQANARNNASYESGERQRMELYYVRNRSLRMDIRILFQTIGAVFSTRGGVLKHALCQSVERYVASCRLLYAVAEPKLVTEITPDPQKWIIPNTHPFYLFTKRCFDILVSALALILLSPVMLLTAVAIKIEDPHAKVFYNAPRGGKDGVPFICHKFTSMCSSADVLKASLMAQNEMNGPVFKIKNDPRVTKVGRIIRKTSIDELPQFYDVLRGKMSLVGPRPLPVAEEDGVARIYRVRELVKPGITCIWQVSGRNKIDFDDWMKMDMTYVQRQSLMLDLKLLLMTIPAVLSHRGAS